MTDELAEGAADEIRAAMASRLADLVVIDKILDVLTEFTIRDRDLMLPGLPKNMAERELQRLVESGGLVSGFRYDPRTKRRAKAYWFPE